MLQETDSDDVIDAHNFFSSEMFLHASRVSNKNHSSRGCVEWQVSWVQLHFAKIGQNVLVACSYCNAMPSGNSGQMLPGPKSGTATPYNSENRKQWGRLECGLIQLWASYIWQNSYYAHENRKTAKENSKWVSLVLRQKPEGCSNDVPHLAKVENSLLYLTVFYRIQITYITELWLQWLQR